MRRRGWLRPALVVLTVGLMAATTYWYFNPQQRPAWVTQRLPVAPGATMTLFRWQDETGQWHVSDEKPAAGVAYEVVNLRNDVNVLPVPDKD